MLGPTLPLPVPAAAQSQSLDPTDAEARTETTRNQRLKQAPGIRAGPQTRNATLGATPESELSRSRRQGLRTKRLGMGRDLRAARLVLGARPDPDPRRSQRQSRSRRLEPSSRSAGKDAGTAESEWGGTQSWSALEVQPDRGRDRSGSGRAPRMSELDRGAWVGTGARHSARPETEPETRPKPSGPQEPEAGRGPGPVPAPARGLELLVRGAESGRAEPARRAGSALGAGASAPETTRRQRPRAAKESSARAGGLPAATLLSRRPQPT